MYSEIKTSMKHIGRMNAIMIYNKENIRLVEVLYSQRILKITSVYFDLKDKQKRLREHFEILQ